MIHPLSSRACEAAVRLRVWGNCEYGMKPGVLRDKLSGQVLGFKPNHILPA